MRLVGVIPIRAHLKDTKGTSRPEGSKTLQNKKTSLLRRSRHLVAYLSEKVTIDEQLRYSKELYDLSVSLVEVQDTIDNYDKYTWLRSFDEFVLSKSSSSLDL